MAKIFRIVSLVSLCCVLHGCRSQATNNSSVVDISAGVEKTQVIVIGTIHDKHHKNPNYSPEILRDIVLSLKPDAILIELPLSLVEPNGRPIEKIRGKNSNCPEVWAADDAAIQLNAKQIPFDRPDRENFYQKTDYFRRRKLSGQQRDQCLELIKKDNPQAVELKISKLQYYAGKAQEYIMLNAGPELINSEAFDSIVRVKDSVWEDILPVFLDKEPRCENGMKNYRFLVNGWKERNRIMAENIIKTAKSYSGKRITVVTGATHRDILRDLLKNEKSIELKEYWQVKIPEKDKQGSDDNRFNG